MSKIQGKQIAESTITQNLLSLGTPTSGDTTSGATIGFVTGYTTSLSGTTVIGPAEDGTYTDGIFTDFTETTRIGVAVDRFNEMFKLLAPTPPSGIWTTAFTAPNPVLTSAVLTARMIGTATSTSNIVITQTPTFTISSTVGTGANARTKDGTFVFTIREYDGSLKETKTINSGSTTDLTGTLRYTIGDPYAGVSGQQGFWTGVTGFSGNTFSSISITPSVTPRNLYFEHPTGQSRTGTTFYVDTATHTPAATGLTIGTRPVMTRYISGVPSLSNGDTFTGINFAITNVSSYFYAPANNVWRISGTRITNLFGDPDSIPATLGATGTVTNKTITVNSGYLESMDITVTPFNRAIGGGTTTAVTYTDLRIDTVSSESSRLVSGTGSYPAAGYGGAWGANSGVSLLTNTDELQMLNGVYVYPTVNYTAFGGPNYSTASGTRWVTFNLGTFVSNNNFTLTFTSAGITSIGQSGLFVQVKIDGATSWVDGNAAYSGAIPNPGSTVTNGDPAVVIGFPSTATVRRITFGSPTYSGNIIVRVGLNAGSSVTITSLTATALV